MTSFLFQEFDPLTLPTFFLSECLTSSPALPIAHFFFQFSYLELHPASDSLESKSYFSRPHGNTGTVYSKEFNGFRSMVSLKIILKKKKTKTAVLYHKGTLTKIIFSKYEFQNFFIKKIDLQTNSQILYES